MGVSLGSATVSLGINSSALSSGVSVAKNVLSQLASGDIGGAVATGLMAAGTAAVGFGVASVGMAANFQSGMSKVAAYAGMTSTQTDSLGKSILSLATQMGQSPTGMADAIFPIISSGYTAAQSLNILKLSAMTAAASGANMATIADALTSSLKAMHAPASAAGSYMDMINKIVAEGKGTVSQYAAVIGKLSLSAVGAKVPFADMGAALATLTTHGFPSVAQASNGLSNLFTQIGPKVDALAAHAAKLGLSFNEQTFKTDSLSQKIAYLNQVTGGNPTEIFKLLGGSKLALQAFTALQGAAGDYTTNLKGMDSANGTTASVFKTTYNDWNNSTARLTSTFQVLMVQVGQGLLPVLTPMLDSVTSIVGAFAGWMSSTNAISNAMSFLGSTAKGVGTALQPVGAMISGLFAGGGKKQASPFAGIMADIKPFLQGFQSMEPAFKAFGASLQSSVGPAVKQIGGLLSGQFSADLKFVGTEVKQIGGWFKSDLAPAITSAMPGFSKLASVIISDVVPGLVKIWTIGQQVSQNVFKALVPVLETVIPIVVQVAGIIANGLGNALQFIMPYVVQAASAIGQFASEIATRVAPILINFFKGVEAGINTFMVIWKAVWPYLAPILMGVFNEIVGVVKVAWAIVSGIIKVGLDLLSGNWSQAWTDVKDMFSGIWSGIAQIIGGFVGIVMGWVNVLTTGVVSLFTGLWNDLVGHSIIPDMVRGIITWFVNLVTGAIGWIQNMVTTIRERVIMFTMAVIVTVQDWVGRIVSWFMNLHTQSVQKVQDMVAGITSTIQGLINNAENFGANLIKNFAAGITGAVGNVKTAIGNVVGAIGNFLPHSPAKEGELSHLNEYGPALVRGFATGIDANASIVQASMLHLVAPASGLGSPAVPQSSANTYAPAVSQGQPVIHNHNYFTVSIDGEELANVMVHPLMNEMVGQVRTNGPVSRVA